MAQRPRVVGIVAGAGSLPREIAVHVTARGDRVQIVSIAGEGDDTDLEPFPLARVGWAQIGGLLRALRTAAVTELVIVGAVRRPDVASLRPDFGAVTNMPAVLRILRTGGDDSILSRIVRFFESKGFNVVSPVDVMPSLRVGPGPLGHERMTASDRADVALGFDVVRALGRFDIGQAVVVADGRIEAIEGAENTDAMLARLAAQRGLAAGNASQGDVADGALRGDARGVLVKRPKPRQEMRVDLPAIGPQTVSRTVAAGLRGVAVLADGAIALERDALAHAADLAGMFVEGVVDEGRETVTPRPLDRVFVPIGTRKPSSQQTADAMKAADAVAALKPFALSEGAVIDRGHILAMACGEGVEALVSRAGKLRQWGRKSRRPPTAVAVVEIQQPDELPKLLACAAASRVATVAVIGCRADALAGFASQADALGLVLLVEHHEREPGEPTP